MRQLAADFSHPEAMMPRTTPGPVTSTITYLGTTYTVADRPPNVPRATRHWWLQFDGAWFQVVRRSTHTPPVEAMRAWLYANAVSVGDDASSDERGPAWTTTEQRPLVFVDGGTLYTVWADSEVHPLPASAEGLYWIVHRSGKSRVAVALDVDDTIVEVLRAVRMG